MKNVALVGAGYWGKNLVRNVARLGRLAAVCDTSEAIRARVALDHPDVPVTGELDGLLAREDVGAVMIAVPAPAHFAVAKAALEAGKHVYVEKPITLDVGEAEALVATAVGLLAAIPAVMAYNWLTGRLAKLDVILEDFSVDYLNVLRRHFFS